MAFNVGQAVGDYQVLEVLGAGGMGTVYKVRHLISDRLEAMKLVLPELVENPELADRFMREIKLQARLSHPNIASLHNAFRIGNQLLMVMELVEGQSLYAAMMGQRQVPIPTAIAITLQVLDALDYAHGQQVVHRDIKPANIMMTTSGHVKLMDFGIARSLLDDRRLTRTGAAVGSIYYMSPEQIQDLPVDGRSDLYSVGVLLYEMITGVRPIDGDSSWSVMNGHVNTVPRPPRAVNPQVNEPLSQVILTALEKSKDKRFQSASAFAGRLRELNTSASPSGSRFGTSPTRPDFQETELAPASPGPVTPQPATIRFDAARLEKLTALLASYMGPMAKVLVNRTAKKAQTWKELCELLAREVPEGVERKEFTAKATLA